MLLTIYRFPNSQKQAICGGCPPPEGSEIIWEGTHEEFEELGFNETQLGYLKMVDGNLVFDEEAKKAKEEEEENIKKIDAIKAENQRIAEEKRLALAEYFEDQMNGFGIPLVVFYEQLASEVRIALQQALDVAQKKGREMNLDYVVYKISTAPKFPEFTDEQFQTFIQDLIKIITG